MLARDLLLLCAMQTRTCEHCEEIIQGRAYRVTSEEDGVILLNMVVCDPCAAEAKNLRLKTVELTIDTDQAIRRNRRSPAPFLRLIQWRGRA